jgi:hypothetical protein
LLIAAGVIFIAFQWSVDCDAALLGALRVLKDDPGAFRRDQQALRAHAKSKAF